MVCRMLLTHLAQNIVLLYLPNPALNGSELRRAVATELKLNVPDDRDLVERIQTELMALHFAGKRVIAMVDEAQAVVG